MIEVTSTLIDKYTNVEQCYRIHLGFKNLAKRFGNERLNHACCYALKYQLLTFKHIKSILETQCDKLDEDKHETCANDEAVEPTPCHHENLRGPDYYTAKIGD